MTMQLLKRKVALHPITDMLI